MTDIANFVAWAVPIRVRKRGIDYFRRRSVKVLSFGPDEAEATVTGSEPYHVRLVREEKKLLGSCSCPYFTDRREICKHVWAALLAADGLDALRGPEDDLPIRLVAEGAAEKSAAPPAQTQTWRDVLGRLPPPEAAPVSDLAEEILYMVDAPASWASQRLVLDIMAGRRKLDGSLGALHPLRMQKAEISNLAEPADREILALVAGPVPVGGWGAYSYRGAEVPSRIELSGPAASFLLPSLCRTGRFRLRRKRGSEISELLTWDDDPAWEIWLEFREGQEKEDGSCFLTGSLRRGEERLAFSEPSLLLSSGHLFQVGQVSRLDLAGFAWIPLLARAGWSLRVPAGEKEDLIERLLSSPTLPRLDLPESLRFEEVRVVPTPRLRLRARGSSREWLAADLSFQYGDREVAALAGDLGLYQRGERRFLLRDPDTERESIDRLRHLGFRLSLSNPRQLSMNVPPNRVPPAVRALLAEGWSVEGEGKLYRSANTLQVSVSSGIDWFEMHGKAEFEGATAGLPELLAALRKGETFITLDDGSLGLIPEEWLQRLGPVAALGQAEGDHLKFKPTQVALLDAWLENEPAATCDEAFESARQRLRSFAGVAPAQAPRSFRGELRGYQKAGLGWLHFLREFGFGGCLADDMGLGKTIQVLALLESRRGGELPSLVVVPKSLIFNWRAEAERFTPKLRVLDHTGAGRTREFAGWDVVLTTYGTLRRDIGALRQAEFDYVILDEAQAIKNAGSQTAKAARLLRGRHRLALTGTPVENHLGELWSLLEFLNPGLLGASPLLRSHSEELRNPGPETRVLLARALRPFLLRRTKEQVAPELPSRVEQTLICELPPHQRRLYDELRDHYRSALAAKVGEQGLGRTKILVLEALLRLRQAACHPGLLDPERADEPSAKLDLLLPQLQEILDEGHKALVFSQFTAFLALLRRQLDREGIPYLYLDGKTRDRQEKVEQFQSDPAFPLFLISLKAGGLGLNLTAADYVYLLDPWWNPAVEAQAIDRAHRIGQTRPVFASRIVAKDTVEEKILELQKSKRELADAIIQADKSLLAALSREDLELLLS